MTFLEMLNEIGKQLGPYGIEHFEIWRDVAYVFVTDEHGDPMIRLTIYMADLPQETVTKIREGEVLLARSVASHLINAVEESDETIRRVALLNRQIIGNLKIR